MKKPIAALAAFALLALAGPAAHADGLSAKVSLTTNYKYRDQDQSAPDKDAVPAIQGGFDYTLGGYYVGNGNPSIGWRSNGQDIEMDFYGGHRGEVGVLGYDVGLLHCYYPGSSSANTTEICGGICYGIATAKLSYVVSDKYFGATDSRGTRYVDLGANDEIAKGITLNARVGFTQLASDSNYGPHYTDYKVGATYAFGNSFSLAGSERTRRAATATSTRRA